jgi:photosystem II stability/assembly factor-like uncharacterized protein
MLFLLFIFSTGYTQTEWTQTNGPLGGDVQALIEIGPDTLIAGTRLGGFYRSEDGGNTWQHIEELPQAPMLFTGIWDLKQNSKGDIFAATSKGVYRSSDKGSTWMAFASGMTNKFTEALAINSADVIFAATRAGVFRSEDNGETWQEFNTGLTEVSLQAIAVTPLGDIVVGTQNGIFISNNNGDNWTEYSEGLTNKWVYDVLPVTEDTLLAGTLGGAFVSTDHGVNWERADGQFGVVYTFGSHSDSVIYTGGGGYFYRSTNYGLNWAPVTANELELGYTGEILATPEKLIIGTFFRGVLQSNDSGETWQETNSGLNVTDVRDMLTLPNGQFLASTNSGLFRTADGGNTWDWLYDANFGADVRTIEVGHTGRIFAGMGSQFAISDNNADSLVLADTSLSEDWPASIAIGNGDTVFVGFYGTIYRSIDNGDTWTEVDYVFPEENIDAMIVAEDGTVFAAANDSGVYRSTDGGDSWEQINNGLEFNPDIIEFLFLPNGDLLAAGYPGVYRTSDEGDTWTKLGPVPTWGLRGMASDSKGNLYISARGGGVAVSEDNGESWIKINDGLYQLDTQGLYIDDMDNIYVCTRGAGVFKTQFVSSLNELSSVSVPETFSLEQNYPNPFNPATTINYELQITNYVELSVYNMLGQELATLVSERQNAGTYQVEWNAAGFASGVYLYKLSVGDNSQVRKMILMK